MLDPQGDQVTTLCCTKKLPTCLGQNSYLRPRDFSQIPDSAPALILSSIREMGLMIANHQRVRHADMAADVGNLIVVLHYLFRYLRLKREPEPANKPMQPAGLRSRRRA